MINPLKTLGEKPWIAQTAGGPTDAYTSDPEGAARIALRFILGIVSVLFFLFIITFLSRSQYPDFQALAGAPWQPFSDPSRLWLNTAILAAASLAMQWGLGGLRQKQLNRAVAGVSAAVLFTLLFLLAQLQLWQQLSQMGFYIDSNPANSYFYLLTAVHGLHLIGGLTVLAWVIQKVWQSEDLGSLAAPLQLCATYWHFLLGVWLVLFALLASSPQTINALAAMCGF